MTERRNLFLVDRDYRRRAAISHCLADCGIHVEPFEDMAEFIAHPPRGGTAFVYDDEVSIGALIEFMERTGRWYPLIAFSENPSTRRVVSVVRRGALDYVAWPSSGEEIAEAVAAAETNANSLMQSKQRQAEARDRVDRLTNREREVLASVARGFSNRTIAENLGISHRTVEIHRANMLSKMVAANSSDAVRIAIDAGLPI